MRLCRWCRVNEVSPKAETCGRRCRQAAYRARRLRQLDPFQACPGLPPGATFAYADPPYPGMARRFYKNEASFGGEVDHRRLVKSLVYGGFSGWAISTSEAALRDLLPLCPSGTRVCPWVKPIGVPPATIGPHHTWEPLLLWGGRLLEGGVRDWLGAQPARLWGSLPGRKPLAFCTWLFDLLGMVPGDKLVDLYPGTGGVARSWRELGRAAPLQRRQGERGRFQLSA